MLNVLLFWVFCFCTGQFVMMPFKAADFQNILEKLFLTLQIYKKKS